MALHRGTVPVDTNVILETHRTGSWRALTGGYSVETVEDCVTETQTGFRRRRPEHRIDQAELRDRLADDANGRGLSVPMMPEAAQRRMLELVPSAAVRNPIVVTSQFLRSTRPPQPLPSAPVSSLQLAIGNFGRGARRSP